MNMTDDTFAKLVAEEVKNRVNTENKKYLLRKENWNRWEKSLIALVQNLNNQVEDIEDDINADTERYSQIEGGSVLLSEALSAYEMRKKKIERFRFHVENRLTQVSKMIATGVEMEDDVMTRLMTLQKAIKRHKELMYEFDLEDTVIDRALWSALEGKWEFESITSKDINDE